MKQSTLCHMTLTTALCISTQISAEEIVMDDQIVIGRSCIGLTCAAGETFSSDGALKLDGNSVTLTFEDSSTTTDFPTADWRIKINDSPANGDEYFRIEDLNNGSAPFEITAGASSNALFVAADGKIGAGTNLPTGNIHVSDLGQSKIVMEAFGWPGQLWSLNSNTLSFFLWDETSLTLPFIVKSGTPSNTIVTTSEGYVGMGTVDPEAPLELWSEESFNFFRISADGAAVNDSVDITFTGGPLGTGQLRYNIVDGDNQEMSLDADGNVVIDGTLTTSGPTCAGGCDRVFDDGYALKSIADHQAQMWDSGYLPGVGPTVAHAPVNVTDKMGGMLNELEHAHIYIGELHSRLEQQDQINAALLTRLSALEEIVQTQ